MEYLFRACILLVIAAVDASLTFPAHRLLQFDVGGAELGSRRAGFDLRATGLNGGVKEETRDLSQRLVVLRAVNLTSSDVARVADLNRAGALLLVLPRARDPLTPPAARALRRLERSMLQRRWEQPVYFAIESPEVDALAATLERAATATATATAAEKEEEELGGDHFRATLTASTPQRRPAPTLRNVLGVINGKAPVIDASSAASEGSSAPALPIVALVAHYDAFGAAPGLATGFDENGSGAIALLELARLFSRLYSQVGSRGSHFDFAGAKHFSRATSSRTLDAVELVLCLDGLVGGLGRHIGPEGAALRLVSSTPLAKGEGAGGGDPGRLRELASSLAAVGAVHGVAVAHVHSALNATAPRHSWEHEPLAKRFLAAATLTARPAAVNVSQHFGGASIFDAHGRDASSAARRLARAVRVIAEALVCHIFNTTPERAAAAIGGRKAVDLAFINRLVESLASTPRVAGSPAAATAAVIEEMESILGAHTEASSRQELVLKSAYTLYDGASGELTVQRVKPPLFHAKILAGVFIYLALLFGALRCLFPPGRE